MKPKLEAPHFRFGTLIHAALEVRYPKGTKRGPHPTKTFEKLYNAQLKTMIQDFKFRDEDGKWNEAYDLGVTMLNGYIDQYGSDADYEVIATEQSFKVPVLVPYGRNGHNRVVNFVGTLDGVWKHRTNKRLVIKDYKTTKNDPTKNQHLVLDEQATAYMSFGADYLHRQGILASSVWPSHMLYTFMHKKMPDERPRNAEGYCLNEDGKVSARQPAPLFHREIVYRDKATRKLFRERVRAQLAEMQGAAVYKSPSKFGKCNMCEFKELCELHEAGGDTKAFAHAVFGTWEPYASHEIEDAERT